MTRYTIRQADGLLLHGPIHGCGGLVEGRHGADRIELEIVRATEGDDLGIYEPRPGHARMWPNYSAAGNGEPVDTDLRGAVLVGYEEV